jgi:hypothetical protein
VERRIRIGEPRGKRAIHACEAGGIVEIFECEVEAEAEEWFRNGHCGQGRGKRSILSE